MKQATCWMVVYLGCMGLAGGSMARGETILSEPFTGTEWSQIDALGWAKEGGNESDMLYVRSDWPVDAGQGALGSLTTNGVWLTFNRPFPARTLADNEVVTVTIALRSGIGTSTKLALLGDTTFTISRSLSDQPGNGYACSDSLNGVVGTSSVQATWWQLYDKPAWYKIVATRNLVQFYFKDDNHPTWTLLGTSPGGVNTITGIQIGGMAPVGGSSTYLQFDTLTVEVAPATGGTLLAESFNGTDWSEITSLGWVKRSGNSGDMLYVRSDWPVDAGQGALGDLAANGVWLNLDKSFSAYALSENDIVTATIVLRSGIGTAMKLALLGDTTFTISRSLGDQPSNGYECSDSVNGVVGTSSVQATWWQLYHQPASYKVVATRSQVQFYFKDINHSDWALLGTSPAGLHTVTGVQIGGMVPSGGTSTYVQFDTLNVWVGLKPADAPIFTPVVNNITPAANIISGPTDIAISSSQTGAAIYYTTDNSVPTSASTRYTGPVTVNGGTTLKAIAVVAGFADSAVTSVTYTVPAFDGPATIPAGVATVDGNLAEWSDATWTTLTVDYDGTPTDIAAASYAVRWSNDKLYIAVKVHDSAHFLPGDYYGWNGSDAVEFYIHTNGAGAIDYPNCGIAQQYALGIKGPGLSAGVWAILGNVSMYPMYMMYVPESAGFTAAGREDGEWLYYEVAITPFTYCGAVTSQANIVSPLKAGDIIGVDVCVIGHDTGAYTGVKSENAKRGKTADWSQIGLHKLVSIPGDANNDGRVDVSDLGILAANYGTTAGATWSTGDFNGDGKVDVSDLGILAANYGTGTGSVLDFNADAKALGLAPEAKEESPATSILGCGSIGLPLMIGLGILGLFLTKLDE